MNSMTEWLDQYFDEVSPVEFYRDLFPEGEMQTKGGYEKGKFNGIYVEVTDKFRTAKLKNGQEKQVPVVKRHMITDGLTEVQEACESDNFCLCSPITYTGKERSAENARYKYAMVFDLDHLRVSESGLPIGLMNLWDGHIINAERLPRPTYIVSSGTGLHLYYVFERAIPLYKNIAKQLQKYKREMTRLIWNEGIVEIKNDNDIQYEGIYQGFRMVGTRTKVSKEDRARAFLTGEKVTMEYMNEFVEEKYQAKDFTYKSKLTLLEAKEKYPEWYDWKITKGKKEVRNPWCVNRNVYEWWKRKIYGEAKVGHRFYCLWILAMYAKKCSYYDAEKNPDPVTYEELDSDAWVFMEYLDGLTNDPNNPFREVDVLDALEGFQDKMITYPLGSIEYKSQIKIERNKRNHQKREYHLEDMRDRKVKMKRRGQEFKAPEGRPVGSGTKENLVKEYRASHPEAKKSDCIKDTGISKKTVYKYWES